MIKFFEPKEERKKNHLAIKYLEFSIREFVKDALWSSFQATWSVCCYLVQAAEFFEELHLKIICQIPGTKPVDTLEKNDSDDYGLEMTELLFGKSAQEHLGMMMILVQVELVKAQKNCEIGLTEI